MNLEKLLKIIQAQRHDFLNHLQVVSGLLQLKKYEQVREYIARVSTEMAQLSKTARVSVPEISAALLTGFYDAAMFQIDMKLAVNTRDRKSTRLNSRHDQISYAVYCLKKKKLFHRSYGLCCQFAQIRYQVW